ncbi:MAG: ABC transporter ATP-binding protein, partial [Clostridiales bacterium]|nr:ABC transporter ATP-binding protein [Clostridiales bacterium]
MARTLESLQKQYNKSAGKHQSLRGGGPRGGRGRFAPMGKKKLNMASVKRLLSYLSDYKGRLILVFVLMIFSTLSSIAGAYSVANIIDGLVYNKTRYFFKGTPFQITFNETKEYLLGVIILVALIYGVGIICSYIQARLMLVISMNSTENIRNELFDKLQELPVRYFDGESTGEVMSRFTNDVDNIDVMLSNTVTSLVSGVIQIIGYSVAMIIKNYWLAIIVFCFIPLFMKFGAMIATRSSKYYTAQQAALGAVNGYIEESVTGAKVVKVFNHEQTCIDEFDLLNNDMRHKQFNAQFYGGIMGPILGNSSQVSCAIVAGIGALLCLFVPESLSRMHFLIPNCTVGVIAAFAQFSRQFSMPINNISQQTSTIFAALAGAERVFAVMDMTPELPDAADAR